MPFNVWNSFVMMPSKPYRSGYGNVLMSIL